ncbi:MAG: tetratricopeptide repeat protein, partial [Planctomycetota bacterium]
LGLCHLKRGKPGDSGKARGYFERLIKEVPESRFIFGAYTGIGDALQVEKKYPAAAAAFAAAQERFEKMSRASRDMVLTKAIRRKALEAQFRQGEMYDLAGEKDRTKYDKAVSIFNSVAANAKRDYPDLYFKAKSAAIKALVSLGSYRLAIEKANDLIREGEKEGFTEFLGGAYLGLADCYFAQYTAAEGKGDGADPHGLVVARYNYLRVLALYFEDRTVLPKAHFRSGRCYERLAQAGEGSKATDRARRHYGRIVAEWPDSLWAKEAKIRLAALKKTPGNTPGRARRNR